MDQFKGALSHRPLLGDEIRLLLLPPGAFNDPICCRLKHVSLSACPVYEALSYVWGDATQTSPMTLNGASYPITKNLESAIRHLRRREGSRTLWVDAVGINQLDRDERSSQVLRMKDIYEQATQVVIWIGEWAPYTGDEVNSAFRLADRVFWQIAKGEYDQKVREELGKTFFKEIHLLDALLRRPWFTRTWVIQEAVVCMTPEDYIAGPNHPIVVCGQSSIPLSNLAIPTTEFDKLSIVRSRDVSKGNPSGIIWIYELRRLRHEIITGKTRLTPVEQLFLFLAKGAAGFEATDARDKIYAFLGLLPPESLPPHLQPNYTYSPDKVFWDYATYILKETRYLEILACCSSSRPGLPSWVPDWKYGLPVTDIHLGKASYLRFLEDNSKIEVECIILCRIVLVLKPIHIPVEFPPYLTLEFESEESVHLDALSKESIVTIVQAVVEVSNYLLAIETKIFGCKALDAGLEASYMRRWMSVIGLGSGARDKTQSRNKFNDEQVYRTLMNIRQFDGNLDMLQELCGGCAMIKENLQYAVYEDDHGNFERTRHGVLPEPGDMICYIKGTTFRFILRPEDSEWRLVGTAPGKMPLSQTEVAPGDLKGLHDPKILEHHEKTRELRKFEDLRIMEDYWEVNKSKTRRIVLH
ncbi:heterokaryon incompatibility protein-domain-containing protein [Hyaloscypha finlandica]|nr:heterokaryon incompatibility protein-domain-containing protein [Hyaloscypha finlandica]